MNITKDLECKLNLNMECLPRKGREIGIVTTHREMFYGAEEIISNYKSNFEIINSTIISDKRCSKNHLDELIRNKYYVFQKQFI